MKPARLNLTFAPNAQSFKLNRFLCLTIKAASVVALQGLAFSSHAQQPNIVLKLDGKLGGSLTGDSNGVTVITADKLSGNSSEDLFLEGDVIVERDGRTIQSDQLNYSPITDTAIGSGNFKASDINVRIQGQEGAFQVGSGSGRVTQPTFELLESGGKGNATRVFYDGIDQLELQNPKYTVCKVPSLNEIEEADWYVKADQLRLDQAAEMATAEGATVVFQDVPILASPYLSFPTSDRRKSGFLSPSFGSSSRGGTEFSLPYYWNIAPNRDLTLTPTVLTQRGIQLGTLARYLGKQNSGRIGIDYLPDDREYNDDRYALAMRHAFNSGRFNAGYNINRVSDDEYFVDFSRSQAIASQRILLREVYANYGRQYWSANIRAVSHQTLQLVNDPLTPPYDRLPEVNINALPVDAWPFVLSAATQFTKFASDTLLEGQRSVTNFRAELPFYRPAYSINTALSVRGVGYDLDQPFVTGGSSGPSSTIPTLSIDGTLYFDRQTSLFGKKVTQTLEPRLFYLRTPFEDQSDQPNFDTTLTAESFSRIFSENRYAGNDRVGDANQITLGVASRTNDLKTGDEILRVEVGQRVYITQPKVVLANETPIEGDSDFFASVQAQVTKDFSVRASQQIESETFRNQRSNLRLTYAPSEGKQLNFGYRYTRTELNQVDISGQWPINPKWSAVARVNYSIEENRSIENLLGLEYNDGCWVGRVVAQRFAVAPELSTTSLFLQLELLGLGRLGSDPRELLSRQVPGYTPNTRVNLND